MNYKRKFETIMKFIMVKLIATTVITRRLLIIDIRNICLEFMSES